MTNIASLKRLKKSGFEVVGKLKADKVKRFHLDEDGNLVLVAYNPKKSVWFHLVRTLTAEILNIICDSGLDAVNSAARLIKFVDADIVITGGTGPMSKASFVLKDTRFGYRISS